MSERMNPLPFKALIEWMLCEKEASGAVFGVSSPYVKKDAGALMLFGEKLENGTTVTAELLKKQGIISKIEKDGLKVLGRGELTKKLDVKAAKFSETAKKAIEAAGGSAEVV